MALVSSSAMFLSSKKGKVVIEWFEWEVTTTPAFLLLSLGILFSSMSPSINCFATLDKPVSSKTLIITPHKV